MKLHANAALSLNQRRRMVCRVVEQGWSLTKAAEAAEVSERTCSKWVGRYRAQGEVGLRDRSSAPKRIPHRTPAERVEVIALLRRLRMTSSEIAECLGMALSTVSAVLKRIGLGKLNRLEPLEPPNRYERRHAGELLHIDVAYAEVLPDEKAITAVAFLRRAVAFYASYGITAQRVMTDNGAGYRSTLHALACRAIGLRHLRTRPRRPRTNGKAERFIKTMIAGWNDGAIYGSSRERTAALDGWLWTYNHRRRHGALGHKPPIARLNELNNLTRFYS